MMHSLYPAPGIHKMRYVYIFLGAIRLLKLGVGCTGQLPGPPFPYPAAVDILRSSMTFTINSIGCESEECSAALPPGHAYMWTMNLPTRKDILDPLHDR